MPEVIVKYNLPEEKDEYRLHNQASELATIVYDFTQLCRSKTKYGSEEDQKIWGPVRDKWWEILNENNFDPYKS